MVTGTMVLMLMVSVVLGGLTHKSQIWGWAGHTFVGYCCHQLAKLVQQTSPKAGGELMTLKLNEVIFWNEPMVTLISVCMVFFCGLGDQPTGPKYEVWQVFFFLLCFWGLLQEDYLVLFWSFCSRTWYDKSPYWPKRQNHWTRKEEREEAQS